MRFHAALAALLLSACSSSNDATDAPGSETGSTDDTGTTNTDDGGTTNETSVTSETGTDAMTPPAAKGPTMGAMIGVNAFIDDPVDKLAPFGNVREYHNWSWNEGNGDASYPGYPNNKLSFSMFSGYWDWDAYYAKLQAAGTDVFPAVQGGVKFVDDGAMPPVAKGADPTKAESYAAHADFMFQMAARYGAAKVDDSKLKLASDQKRSTGLGLLHYYEDGNEPDAWWVRPGGAPLITAEQYAAMASADRDGDQGRMGKTFGIRNADPNAKLVMAGLAGKDPWDTSIKSYLDGIKAWSVAHRGGELPFDVINVHTYAFGPAKAGISPEEFKLTEQLKKISAWRDANAPKAEIWLTEFGYDTAQASPLHAPKIGDNSPEIVQAQWIVRSYIAIAEAGYDRGVLFMSRDACTVKGGETCATQFGTSGVMSEKGSWIPKPSFYFIAAFRSRLAKMRFVKELDSGSPDVRIATFQDDAGKGAYVVWAPTSSAKVVSSYTLKGVTSGTLVTLADKDSKGAEKSFTGTMDITETPSIVLVDHL